MSGWLLVAVTLACASSSLDLTGANSYAFTPDAAAFDFAGSFTIDLQFKSTDATDGCLLAKFHQSSGSTTDDSYYIKLLASGTVEARIQTTSLPVTLTGGGGAHDGNWHHVALVCDPANSVAELYLDGALIASEACTTPARNSSEPIRLGTLRTTGVLTDFFDGYLDELRFWNVARRGEQAACLSAVTVLNETPGLVSYYHFDEETGSDALDEIAPDEDFQLISGAVFGAVEPIILSRLAGPGQCLCGSIEGLFTANDPAITLVGDSVRVAAADSLRLAGVSVTLDSSVQDFVIEGFLSTALDVSDSCRFAPQAGGFAGSIEFAGDTTSAITYSMFSGFADYALHVSNGLSLAHCSFHGPGGGVRAEFCTLQIDSSRFETCAASLTGGAVSLDHVTASISACEFVDNLAPDGMALCADSCALAIHDCVLRDHTSALTDSGAVISLTACAPLPDHALLSRLLLFDNQIGGSLIKLGSSSEAPSLRNLTVTANAAQALLLSDGAATVSSSILIGNTSNVLSGEWNVYYSIVGDASYLNQNGNLSADPLFLDSEARTFGLTAGSPAINRGDPDTLFNDADGTRNDIGAFAAASFAPTLESILDVPNDNGRQVMIQWLPSAGDDELGGIARYSVWRRVNLATLENFELIAELPAGQLPGYGQIAPTLADSNQLGLRYYAYFVRAQSQNPLAFWDTPLDSGYSVDNLSPQVPALLAALDLNAVRLTWNAVPDSDLAYYAIFRADSTFSPDTLTIPYLTTTDTTALDTDLSEPQYAYVVRAVDLNGNVSDASNVETVALTLLPKPVALTASVESGLIVLRWIGSPETGQYALYRTSIFGEDWTRFATTPDTFFVTSPTAPLYFYRVHAEP